MIKNESKKGLAAVKATFNIFSEEDTFMEKTWEVRNNNK